jgi:hypothetical protein
VVEAGLSKEDITRLLVMELLYPSSFLDELDKNKKLTNLYIKTFEGYYNAAWLRRVLKELDRELP